MLELYNGFEIWGGSFPDFDGVGYLVEVHDSNGNTILSCKKRIQGTELVESYKGIPKIKIIYLLKDQLVRNIKSEIDTELLVRYKPESVKNN